MYVTPWMYPRCLGPDNRKEHWVSGLDTGSVGVCDNTLRKHWEIPPDAKAVQVALSTKPIAEGVKVYFEIRQGFHALAGQYWRVHYSFKTKRPGALRGMLYETFENWLLKRLHGRKCGVIELYACIYYK
jgi:hypothetical protein